MSAKFIYYVLKFDILLPAKFELYFEESRSSKSGPRSQDHATWLKKYILLNVCGWVSYQPSIVPIGGAYDARLATIHERD